MSPYHRSTLLLSFTARTAGKTSSTASLPNLPPEPVGRRRHVDVRDPKGCERVAYGVDHRRAGRDGAGLSDALHSQLVGRARGDGPVERELGDLVRCRDRVVEERGSAELAGPLVIHRLLEE